MSGFCHTRERTDKPLRSTVSKSRYAAHTDRLSGVHTPRPSLVRVPEWSRIQPLTAMWMCPELSSQTYNRAVSSLTVTIEWFDFHFRADFKRRVILRYHDLKFVEQAGPLTLIGLPGLGMFAALETGLFRRLWGGYERASPGAIRVARRHHPG